MKWLHSAFGMQSFFSVLFKEDRIYLKQFSNFSTFFFFKFNYAVLKSKSKAASTLASDEREL